MNKLLISLSKTNGAIVTTFVSIIRTSRLFDLIKRDSIKWSDDKGQRSQGSEGTSKKLNENATVFFISADFGSAISSDSFDGMIKQQQFRICAVEHMIDSIDWVVQVKATERLLRNKGQDAVHPVGAATLSSSVYLAYPTN